MKSTSTRLEDPAWNRFVKGRRRDIPTLFGPVHIVQAGEGPDVLLVHGYADSTYTWHANAPALVRAGFRVILVDQPGLGRSFRPPRGYRFSIEQQAEVIFQAVREIVMPPLCLLGHSMGGSLVLWLAHHYPDWVRAVVAVAPPCRKPWKRTLALPGIHRLAARLPRGILIRMALQKLVRHPQNLPPHVFSEYCRAASRPDFFISLAGLARHFFSPSFHDLFRSAASIHRPCLLAWGDTDPWVPLPWGLSFAHQLPHAALETFPHGGHLLHQENHQQFNSICIAFFRDPDHFLSGSERFKDSI